MRSSRTDGWAEGFTKGKGLLLMRKKTFLVRITDDEVVIVSPFPEILERFCFQSTCRVTSILHMWKSLFTQNLLAQALTRDFLFLRILIHLLDTRKGLSTHDTAKDFTPVALPVFSLSIKCQLRQNGNKHLRHKH